MLMSQIKEAINSERDKYIEQDNIEYWINNDTEELYNKLLSVRATGISFLITIREITAIKLYLT